MTRHFSQILRTDARTFMPHLASITNTIFYQAFIKSVKFNLLIKVQNSKQSYKCPLIAELFLITKAVSNSSLGQIVGS